MPETEIRLREACHFILALFEEKRRGEGRVQKSRAKAREFRPSRPRTANCGPSVQDCPAHSRRETRRLPGTRNSLVGVVPAAPTGDREASRALAKPLRANAGRS